MIYVLIIAIIVIIIFVIAEYNSIINLRKKMEQSKASIDVYLKQRFDLIPNLVSCVKEYAKYESETLEKILKMRSKYFESNKSLEEATTLNNEFNNLLMLAEGYPDLKASDQFLSLQKSLIKMESQLQAARRIYNTEVTSYNTKISVFPSNIVGKIFGFTAQPLFEIPENEKLNVKVEI